MKLDRIVINPTLQAFDPLLPNRSLFVESVRSSVCCPDLLLQLLDRRTQLSRSRLLDEMVSEGVDLGCTESTNSRGIVERESLDADKTVVEKPLREEALWRSSQSARVQSRKGRKGRTCSFGTIAQIVKLYRLGASETVGTPSFGTAAPPLSAWKESSSVGSRMSEEGCERTGRAAKSK